MAFDLRTRIREALDQSPSADPAQVAADLLVAFKPSEVRAALAETLPQFVVGIVTHDRSTAMSAVPAKGDQVGSRRWTAAASFLNERTFTADGWKRLRELTAADLIWTADFRRTQAAGLVANAEKYEALASLMESRGASTVGDLAEDEVQEVLAA